MSFKPVLYLGLLPLFFLLSHSQAESLDNQSQASLSAQPNHCVALRQGRRCFAKISLHWKAPKEGTYCLIKKQVSVPLHCWPNRKSGQYELELAETDSVDYQLIDKQNQQAIAETRITISWVYNTKRKKRRWRLF